MGVGGLHDIIVGPVGLGHVRELAQLVHVVIHVVLVRCAAQHSVDDGGHFGPSDGVVGTEGAVLVTGDPAVLDGADHLLVEPIICAHISEDILAAGVQVGKAHGDHSELCAGNGAIRGKLIVTDALSNADGGQGIHRVRIISTSFPPLSFAAGVGSATS